MMMSKKKKNKVITFSTIEQDLGEDLIVEILSRLPPITLVRFKSVSKTWYSLISNHDFRRRHTALYQFHRSNHYGHIHDDHHMLEESSPPPGILLRRGFCVGDSNIVIYPHPSGLDHEQKNLALLVQNLNDYRPVALNESSVVAPLKYEAFMLYDSCNGLLLYVHTSRVIRKEEEEEVKVCRTLYVCNPITKEYIKLPTIDPQLDMNTGAVKIVFNPSFSLTYKVFTWIVTPTSTSGSFKTYRLYVYSSEARSWRLSVSIPIAEFPLIVCGGLKAVLWNGVLHWTSFVGGSLITTDVALSLCYDIEKETVWTMKFPKMATGEQGYSTHRTLLYFGLCGERLLLIQKSYISNGNDHYHLECVPTSFYVMELKQQQQQQHNRDGGDGEGEDMWSVRYHVNFNEVDYDYYLRPKVITNLFMGDYVSILDIYRTMGRNKKEEEEEMLLIKVGSNRMVSFSLTNNTFGLIEELLPDREIKAFLCYTNIFRYTITLYPP